MARGPTPWPGGKGEGWGLKRDDKNGGGAGVADVAPVPGRRTELPTPAEKDFVAAISVTIGDGQAVFDR